MIVINQLAMAYGSKVLFYDVNLKLNSGKCYALVGANGAGKSTFFKILNGVEEPTGGEILFPKNATFGWLKQDQYRYEDLPIREVVLMGNQKLWQTIKERDALFTREDWDEETGYRFSQLELNSVGRNDAPRLLTCRKHDFCAFKLRNFPKRLSGEMRSFFS